MLAELSTSKLKKMLTGSLSPQAPEVTANNISTENLLLAITGSLEKFDLENLNHYLQKARYELNTKEIIINLVRPLLQRVGQMVAENKITIPQEHLLSSLLRDYLGNLHQSLSPYEHSARRNSPVIVLTTREGDYHEFGIMLSAILCNLYRYKIYYLGTSTPAEDLVAFCRQIQPNYILLGFTVLPATHELVTSSSLLAQLHRALPRQVTFLTGGFPRGEELPNMGERVVKQVNDMQDLDQWLSSYA
jgi:methanogenic corrinoid protein MtbC1